MSATNGFLLGEAPPSPGWLRPLRVGIARRSQSLEVKPKLA
ncbi:hypothetical protein [Parapedobacter sp.]